jgi:hypothetical protein
VIEAFALEFTVPWPISLVVSCYALSKYQMLFRHLFYCKYIEKRLGDAWLNHQAIKEFSIRNEMSSSFQLRQRMLHFQQNLLYYMMVEVISPRWHAFQRQLADVQTVDDIIEHHGAFLDMCLKECLLSDPGLLRMIYTLMNHCVALVDEVEHLTGPHVLDEETIKAERERERDRRAEKRAQEAAEAAMSKFNKTLGKKKTTLKRRESSYADLRKQRIKNISDEIRHSITVINEGETTNSFRRRTLDLQIKFDSHFADFMSQLMRRSNLQVCLHIAIESFGTRVTQRLDFVMPTARCPPVEPLHSTGLQRILRREGQGTARAAVSASAVICSHRHKQIQQYSLVTLTRSLYCRDWLETKPA